MKAKIIAVNISEKKGTVKKNVGKGFFRKDYGLVGDAHAGPGIRQVSLLANESHEKMKKNPDLRHCLKFGDFGENLTTEGIVLHKLKIGTKLKIGDVLLEISKIGKECHYQCAIRKKIGRCIMPTEGIFAIVLSEGEIKVNDDIELQTAV